MMMVLGLYVFMLRTVPYQEAFIQDCRFVP